jgi:primosomal protein N' (replication factor Y)
MVLAPGDYVEVPLGPRSHDRRGLGGEARRLTNLRIRDVVQRFDAPPMPETHRKFIDWLSAYYLEPMGNVLRMVLRAPAALEPDRANRWLIGSVRPRNA